MKKAKKSSQKRKKPPRRARRAAQRLVVRTRGAPKRKRPRAAPEPQPLTAAQVQKFRDALVQKRDDLLDIVQRKKEQEVQETDVGDEADIATQSVEKEILFELTDSEKQTLDKVEAALRKMDKGVYGRCESCHRNIPRLRLEIMPWARYCVNCQAEQDVPASEPLI